MKYTITSIDIKEYPEAIEIWEASVRATHDFVSEEDIQRYKPLILNEYFKAVELLAIRDEHHVILGFSGVADRIIEMLFIAPEHRGKGLGRELVINCINVLDCNKVDVNEQNKQAVGFYERMGFKTEQRSELDGEGRPYPILHMELKTRID
ncbi:GNAT family N-acetyltransferase [Prolixibacteraceae bacterium]|nr:GNAT family N-acetyltransferase [Prolixibacteraceae bacterium]